MIFGTGKWTYRNILLTACDAARRFLPRLSPSATRRIAWKPLVLRWKRRAKQQATGVTKRSLRSITQLSFPQFHFYFSSFNSGMRLVDASSKLTILKRTTLQRIGSSAGGLKSELACPEITERSNVKTVGASIKAASSTPRVASKRVIFGRTNEDAGSATVNPVFRASLAGSLGSSSSNVRGSLNIDRMRPRRPYGSPSLMTHAGPHRLPFPTAVIMSRSSRFESSDIQAPQALTGFRRSDELLTARPHRGEQLSAAPQVRQLSDRYQQGRVDAVSQVSRRFKVTEELIWRRQKAAITNVVERVNQLESLYSERVSHAPSESTRQDVFRLPAPAEVRSITQLDRSLIDRLTDDVIRKVDQRVRIERERRGL